MTIEERTNRTVGYAEVCQVLIVSPDFDILSPPPRGVV
jgi:hypothetical protein